MEKPKKNKRKIIIPVIIVAVAVISLLLVNPVRSVIAIISMNPLDSQELMTDIFAIKNSFVNLYLIKTGDKYIAFDAGADEKATKTALDNLGIDENNVAAVFLTHTDNDHTAAVSLFSSAVIYMSESNRSFIGVNEGRTRSKTFLDIKREYEILTDDETITVDGVQIQCIFTPGHTPGSACYIVNGRYLFAGDNLNLDNGKAVLFTNVFNMDDETQKQSLHKLSTISGIEAIFTMHTGYTTDFMAAFADWSE